MGRPSTSSDLPFASLAQASKTSTVPDSSSSSNHETRLFHFFSVHQLSPTTATMSASQEDIEKLTDSDKAELRAFVANEQQRSQIQARTLSRPCRPQTSSRPGRMAIWKACACIDADEILLNRNPLHHTALLEQVRHRQHQEPQARPVRGDVSGQLRGPLPGHQLPDDEAPEQHEGFIGRVWLRSDHARGRAGPPMYEFYLEDGMGTTGCMHVNVRIESAQAHRSTCCRVQYNTRFTLPTLGH